MNIRCSKSEFSAALNNVSKAASQKSPNPLLKCVLLEANEDGSLSLSATDNDFSIRHEIGAEVETGGRVAVPVKLFGDLIRKLPGEEVDITTDEMFNVKVVSGMSDFTLAGMDGEQFPDIYEIEKQKSIFIKSGRLEKMVNMTSFAASIDESRGALTGILIEAADDSIKMVAIDGYRMSIVSEQAEESEGGTGEGSVVINARIMKEVSRIVSDNSADPEEVIEIILNDNSACIYLNRIMIIMRLVEGAFVNYNAFLADDFSTDLRVYKDDLKAGLDRVSLMSRENKNHLVKMKIISNEITLLSKSDAGYVREELRCDKEGNDIELGFNSKYMLEALNCIEDNDIEIVFNSPTKPFIIRPVDGDRYIFLLLPIRISA